MLPCKRSERFLKLQKKYMSLHSDSRSAGSRTSEREKNNRLPLKGSLIAGEVATSHCSWQQNSWMTTNRKLLLKSEFPLFQISSMLFEFISFVNFRRNLCCVHLLHKAGAWKVSCKKCTIKRDAQVKLLFFLKLPFSLPCAVVVALPISLIVVIEKFGCKDNVMSHYSSLWVAWLAQFSYIKLLKVHSSLQSTFFTP